jgi:hypothetical protein
VKVLGIGAAAALALALAGGLYASPLPAAAGHRLEAQVRRTVSCATALGALQISAYANNPTIFSGTAGASMTTGDPTTPSDGLVGVSSQLKHYSLSKTCHSVTKRVVLSHRGLTSAGASHAGDIRWTAAYCAATRRVLLRVVLAFDTQQKPVSATIEAWTQPKAHSGKKSKRIGFVQWSPKRSITYYSASACTTQIQ